ncbi:histidine kinase [Pedobacter frigidisoli]|uniref:Histidine kinase n=1 Tax=Pedobacter frigidisoli TaxID=2530455 RepID=A0A4R0NW61_9SPHI|nr:sensor histidine kinase [Pedobacter frigidisoli]TCD05932.1 histidine kinase [Pedobacter frigidisoli]
MEQNKTDSVNNSNDRILQFIIHKRFRIHRHLAFILLLITLLLNAKDALTEPANTYIKIVAFFVLLALFYLNMYYLIPRFIFRERYFAFGLWVVGLLALIMLIVFIARHYLEHFGIDAVQRPSSGPKVIAISVSFCTTIAAIVAVKLFQRSIVMSQRLNALETATMQSELEQLKNQINPHFLFNTLHNVNVLTQTDPAKASQILIRLSDLLHYQLYDSTMSEVLLTADIRFIEDFLNLEKIRRDVFDFDITLRGDLSGVLVPPLLFITFVENAVKHNLDAVNSSYVYISFALKENVLCFNCLNSKPATAPILNKKGGLGLVNVKRRMELLFANRHYLYIDDKKDQFNVELKLNI